MRIITIYELKRRNKLNGGHFFDRDTMKQWGDTLKSFRIEKLEDTKMVHVIRKRDGETWLFDTANGRCLVS